MEKKHIGTALMVSGLLMMAFGVGVKASNPSPEQLLAGNCFNLQNNVFDKRTGFTYSINSCFGKSLGIKYITWKLIKIEQANGDSAVNIYRPSLAEIKAEKDVLDSTAAESYRATAIANGTWKGHIPNELIPNHTLDDAEKSLIAKHYNKGR